MRRNLFQNCHNQYRSLHIECLEDRQLLSVSQTEIQSIRDTYDDFSIEDDVNVIEIDSSQISTLALQTAIRTAQETASDDLIFIRTNSQNKTLAFSNASDEFVIDTNIESKGIITIVTYGDNPLTINANSISRIFCLKSGTVQLGNLVLTKGKALTDLDGNLAKAGMGGAIANAGTLKLSNVTVKNNVADCGTFEDDNIEFNSKGGGIYNCGSLLITDSIISNNTAKAGQVNKNGIAAYGTGGGIFNDTDATLDLRNTTISNNIAEVGIRIIQPEPTSEYGQSIDINVEMHGSGGGICNFGTTMISTESVVSNNSASFGGGIASLFDTKSSSITLANSQVYENNTYESGGGLYSEPGCNVSILHSMFQGNSAGTSGGGITSRGELSLVNSVLSGNRAGTNGGGLYSCGTYDPHVDVYTVNIVNSTITGNSSGTMQAGSGSGIYFQGVQNGNTFAVLSIANSIIVLNRIENSASVNVDTNLCVSGTCNGKNTLATFSQWSNKNSVNYVYDETIPLFVRNYSFNNKTEGDYRIIFDNESQSIDCGNNTDAQSVGLDLESKDVLGQPRIQNSKIDLGAYEYQPSQFDSAFPSRLFVQQGCSFNLRCQGTDSKGNAYTQYFVDLNGDGSYDKIGDDLWISWDELSSGEGFKGYLWLAVKNSLGEISEMRQVAINVNETLPSISLKRQNVYYDQIVKLNISVFCYGRSIQQWSINWGDESTPYQYNCLSQSLSTAHYYAPTTNTKTYPITLNLIDTNGNGGEITYYLGSHTIAATRSASALPEQSPSVASVSAETTMESAFPVEESAFVFDSKNEPSVSIFLMDSETRDDDQLKTNTCVSSWHLTSSNDNDSDLSSRAELPIILSSSEPFGKQLPAPGFVFLSEEDEQYDFIAEENLSSSVKKKSHEDLAVSFSFFDDDILEII